jgi:hypothetical protein
VHRRNAASWESILARLRPDWEASALCELCHCEQQCGRTWAERWCRIAGAHGLWAMYSNAGVMLEIADYASQHSTVAEALIADLRSDAMRIRICILQTMARIALNVVNESLCMSVLRAESAYAEMVLRITGLLEASAGQIVPEFVAAL